MASMAKLYPPVIANTIPAFYEENGTVIITVPFSMSRAVDALLIGGFKLKVKTAQSNTYILTLTSEEVSSSITNGYVKFYWRSTDSVSYTNNLKLGLFYKFLLAYISKAEPHTVGYFSSVAVGKYTSCPIVTIQDATVENDTSGIAIFKKTYIGLFEVGEDLSERPYQYNFYLYDANGLVEESGWQLHNTVQDDVDDERFLLETSYDKYTYLTTLKEDTEYYILYGVRTINNLEIFSPMYPCIEPLPQNSLLNIHLIAENIFEEGYINLSITTDLDVENAQLNLPVSVEICRAEKTDNYQSWILLRRAYFNSYRKAVNWSMKDFTIELGITYKYCIREYNSFGLYTQRILSEPVIADFEDMFLYDGKRLLKIRFNPKMSSFKATKLEQKLDTIGSKYPFIFKNGIVDYKEFPISGLISYKVDNNELFINHIDDLNIILGKYPRRSGTPLDKDENDIDTNNDGYLDEKSWELSETLDSVGYNIRAERRFKLQVLEWLNNSEIKLFRTPTEGSYLVRLMNISMSPEDRLGRMLHNFSCLAYEVDELNYDNLLAYGFINIDQETNFESEQKSINFIDRIPENVQYYDSYKINDMDIYDYLYILYSPNTQYNLFYVRIGSDSPSSKTLIIGQKGFMLKYPNLHLPDVYFNPSDNAEFLPDGIENSDSQTLKNALINLFGSTSLNSIGASLLFNGIGITVASGQIVQEVQVPGENDLIEILKNVYISSKAETITQKLLQNGDPLPLKEALGLDERVYSNDLINYIYKDLTKIYNITFYKYNIINITDENIVSPLDIVIDGVSVIPDWSIIYCKSLGDGTYDLYKKDNNGVYLLHAQYDINDLFTYTYIIPSTDEIEEYSETASLGSIAFKSIDDSQLNANAAIKMGNGLYYNIGYLIKITETERRSRS